MAEVEAEAGGVVAVEAEAATTLVDMAAGEEEDTEAEEAEEDATGGELRLITAIRLIFTSLVPVWVCLIDQP